jgi:glycosyltransferase involved in cell wall biosynthesis
MYFVKRLFDEAVARRIDAHASAVVGMPGACLTTFRRPIDGVRVFHAVDAHPAELNALLHGYYGVSARREMVQGAQIERIDSELELADIVLVPSNLVRRQMTRQGVPDDRVRIAPYGVNFGLFSPQAAQQVNAVPHILYVGQVSYRKGIPFLLEAARNQPFTVELIGPVVAPELLEDLPPNVRYTAAVGHGELPAAFKRSDALVLPSVEDAFALVVAEALGSGLPVVTTSSVGSSVLIQGPQDGVVVPAGDVAALRGSLVEVRPLSPEDRVERAERHRSPQGGVSSWDEYARTVAAVIEGS